MSVNHLPRDPKQQKSWARRLAAQVSVPPICAFVYERETFRMAYPRVFRRAFELGAIAALEGVLKELERSDDPCEGLPPHLRKAATAAAAAVRRRRSAAAPAHQPEIPRRPLGAVD